MITIRSLSSDRGTLCKVPASCSYPRTAVGPHGAEAHGQQQLPGSVFRQSGRRRTAADAADMRPALRATSGHIPGRQPHRAACRRSIPYVPCNTPAPVRRSRHSRDSGRGVSVSWASQSPLRLPKIHGYRRRNRRPGSSWPCPAP